MEKDSRIQKLSKLSLNGDWEFRQKGKDDWLPATVPGCNFTDLMANDRIQDPFFADNELSLQWVEQEDWEYRRVINLTRADLECSEIELVAEGLDTFCDIYLNGVLVTSSDNMFVAVRVACQEYLRPGKNLLAIYFRSPIKETYPKYVKSGISYPAENDKAEAKLSVYCRKAGYHFGWDWGPRFVTSGIWRNIYLELVQRAKIKEVIFRQTNLSTTRVEFSFQLIIENHLLTDGEIRVFCVEAPELDLKRPLHVGDGGQKPSSHTVTFELSLSEPNLWWPNQLGEPHLYHFRFELFDKAGMLHVQEETVGFRSVEVINKPDEMGESFFVKVNGRPVFMKGANYIPADSFLHRVTPEVHKRFFDAVVYANMNMLRVWGGGVYQDDSFYRLADEYGILIWQDFMFACSLYPGDDEFINNVRREAEFNVRRLRNHPCLAMWCGNNEVEMAIAHWDWPKLFKYSNELFEHLKRDYMRLFDQCLPEVLQQHDPERFYLRSSPIGFWESEDDHKGDHHYWGVWHAEEPFSEYQRRIPRFMSEFGFQSFPISDSVERFISPADRDIDSHVMQVHQKHPRGNTLILSYLKDEYRLPKDFDSLLYLSQVQQALGLKQAFEAHRGAMPYCMGSLYWQLNDTWPAASWSGIDYYGRWKALHYQVRRSFREQLLVIRHEQDSVRVILVSDSWRDLNLTLELSSMDMKGRPLWSRELNVEIPSTSSKQVFEVPASELLKSRSRNEVIVWARLLDDAKRVIAENNHFFVANRDLALRRPRLTTQAWIENHRLTVSIETDVVVRQLYINAQGLSGNFSDNFFDLCPGVRKRVTLDLPPQEQLDENTIVDRMSYFSLVDSYDA